jgi:hypothetical protein
VREEESKPEEEDDLTCGPHMLVSVGGASEYLFGRVLGWAVGRIRGWARFSPAASLPRFLFFLFLFQISISFISFAKQLQMSPNKILKFSKIQGIISR